MKATTILLAGFFSMTSLFPTMASNRHVQKKAKKQQEESHLRLAGKVTNRDFSLSGATINLYCDNDLVRTIFSKGNGTFKLDLDLDCNYTLECEMPGFVTKRIAITTAVPQKNIKIPCFRFSMEIFQKGDFSGVDDFMVDFPVALISYEPQYKRFDYHLEYTHNTQVEHEKLRFESFLLNKKRF